MTRGLKTEGRTPHRVVRIEGVVLWMGKGCQRASSGEKNQRVDIKLKWPCTVIVEAITILMTIGATQSSTGSCESTLRIDCVSISSESS
jgi:hypothetical protein